MPSNRSLANASEDVRKRVASKGGQAPHPRGRGMQNVPEWKRKQIARLGGLARHARPEEQKEKERESMRMPA